MPEQDAGQHRGQLGGQQSGPLAGLRVVELSAFVASPLAGMTLAQLGADVVRVEPLTGGPDRGRWPLAADGSSLYWAGLNRGKRAVAVDLARPEGRRLVADLVVDAGALLTNTERWPELSGAALRVRRPDLVHVLLTGRHDGSTAVDYTVQAATGFPLVTGPAGHGAPVNHVLPAWDLAAGLYLATGLLAADAERRRTGVGRDVRVALEDVALATAGQLGLLGEAQLAPERTRRPDGNHVHGTFGLDLVAGDGTRWMVVAVTGRQWHDLLVATGLTEVVGLLAERLGADLDDEGERWRHRRLLGALLQDWAEARDAETVEAALTTTRALWSPYRSFADLAADDAALLRAHPLFSEVRESAGDYLAPGSPLSLDGVRADPAPAPGVGRDTEAVLADLGVDAAARTALRADGLIPDEPAQPRPTQPVVEWFLRSRGTRCLEGLVETGTPSRRRPDEPDPADPPDPSHEKEN